MMKDCSDRYLGYDIQISLLYSLTAVIVTALRGWSKVDLYIGSRIIKFGQRTPSDARIQNERRRAACQSVYIVSGRV